MLEYVQVAPASNTPMASAATTVRGMLSIRPITAAARMRSRISSPPAVTVWNPPNPRTGTCNKMARVDNTAASTQMMVSRRATEIPSRVARSLFSAAARMPSPYLE